MFAASSSTLRRRSIALAPDVRQEAPNLSTGGLDDERCCDVFVVNVASHFCHRVKLSKCHARGKRESDHIRHCLLKWRSTDASSRKHVKVRLATRKSVSFVNVETRGDIGCSSSANFLADLRTRVRVSAGVPYLRLPRPERMAVSARAREMKKITRGGPSRRVTAL